jgi:hypothetical protein
MPPRSVLPSAILRLFAMRPAPVQELALCARQLLLSALPEAIELPDAKANLVGYGYGTGYKDVVATLILSKVGVKIGLAQGACLPDPTLLLHGAGKVHRHIDIRAREQLRPAEVKQLVQAALSAYRRRSKESKRTKKST